MPPNFTSPTFRSELKKQILESEACDGALAKKTVNPSNAAERDIELVWSNIILFTGVHLAALYGMWLCITSAMWYTRLFFLWLFVFTGFGITGGAHRLWAHRTYKAKWQLKLILMILNTMAFQDSIYIWSRDHRVHHKYSETDADPHNAKRGLFFSHIGWLLCRKHPDVRSKGKLIDLSDLEADPFVMFQKRYYAPMMIIGCFILPTIIPMYYWNESFVNAFFVCAMFRWCGTLNSTWAVNSVAHAIGNRPYDESINPCENIGVSIFAFGEGFHNYHHVFPWDYKTAEWGGQLVTGTTTLIELFAKIGWAYDLKMVSREVIERRVKRTGDGSHSIWGWGDKDLTKSDKDEVFIKNRVN